MADRASFKSLAVLGAIAGLALVASPAPAAGVGNKKPNRGSRAKTITVRADAEIPAANGRVEISAACPPGTDVVGGGFGGPAVFTPPPGPAQLAAAAFPVASLRNGDSWQVTLDATPGFLGVTSVAECRSGKGSVHEVRAVGPMSTHPTTPSTATATCPRGQTAVSGGFTEFPALVSTISHFDLVTESYRSSRRSWTASAVPWREPSVTVTSYAYCRRAKRLAVKVLSSELPATVGSGVNLATGRCRHGLAASGGGFRTPPTSGAFVGTLIHPSAAHLFPGSWQLYAQELAGGSGGPITAFAYCS